MYCWFGHYLKGQSLDCLEHPASNLLLKPINSKEFEAYSSFHSIPTEQQILFLGQNKDLISSQSNKKVPSGATKSLSTNLTLGSELINGGLVIAANFLKQLVTGVFHSSYLPLTNLFGNEVVVFESDAITADRLSVRGIPKLNLRIKPPSLTGTIVVIS